MGSQDEARRTIGVPQRTRALLALPCLALLTLAALLGAPPAPASAAEECPNEAIREEQSATYLPDCRAYEMVSPPYKNGFPPIQIQAASEDGARLIVNSLGMFSNPAGPGSVFGTYEVKRTPLGWESVPMDAPASTFASFQVQATNPEFTRSLWFGQAPQQSIPDVYRAMSPQGPFASIGPEGPPTLKTGALAMVGASRDLSHSVYRVHAPNLEEKSLLWPGDRTIGVGEVSLYEYSGTGNLEPRLVGVSDEHEVPHIAESHLISECGTYLGAKRGSAYNAISSSGSTVFFTALAACGGGSGPSVNELYARIDGEHTVAISEPSVADCAQCSTSILAGAVYQGASEDGSRAFFTTAQKLLGSDATRNLYLYDFSAPEGEKLTEVSATADPEGARVQRVLRISEEGTHVYFTAQGVLATNPGAAEPQPGVHASAEDGAENLYLYQRDAAHPAGQLTFIASAAFGENVQVTPDGRFLLFESPTDLTADQHELPEAGQVFEYNAASATLIRVSRGQDGFNQDGNSSLYQASIPAQDHETALSVNEFTKLALSNDGAYVFFTSADTLTPQVSEGTTNVYQYHQGQVSLISDGRDLTNIFGESAVELLGTDQSGRDVFFRTANSLLSQDTDTQLDFYDARVDGGFPSPPPPPSCSGDPCHGAQAQHPAVQSPATPGFTGPGNPSSAHRKKHRKRHQKRHGHRADTNRGGSR